MMPIPPATKLQNFIRREQHHKVQQQPSPALIMASNLIEEEDYASSEDSDFALDQVPKNDSDSEASDSEASDRPSKRRKVAAAGQSQDPEDPGYANSGDEAIIKKGAKKERRKRKDDEDEEGGEGGLIKTRRQRAQEYSRRGVMRDNSEG